MLEVQRGKVTQDELGCEISQNKAVVQKEDADEFSQWLLSQPHPEAKDILFEHTLLKEPPLLESEIVYYQMKMSKECFEKMLHHPSKALPTLSTTREWYQFQSENHFYIDFAHPTAFGGGFRSFGNVQEETLFVEFPRLAHLAFATKQDPIHCVDEEENEPTPVIICNLKRRFQLEGLYGASLEKTALDEIKNHIQRLTFSYKVNIIAMSAKKYPLEKKHYTLNDLVYHLKTAFLAFHGASLLQKPCVIHTGAWGSGVFANSEKMMTLLQCLAAQMAEVQIVFEGVNLGDHPDYTAALIEQAKLFLKEAKSPQALLEKLLSLQKSDPSWAIKH